ncbi:hypothetical protein [Pendulispora albinea]|uniref:Uncharacterized protein n=1 Tax=Pendulispora albinea TaxID=2741071 RepID=A0ABZ2LTS0_9BACT
MIAIAPEAALEILESREFYESRRAGLGLAFQGAVNGMLDAIKNGPLGFPRHRFTTHENVRRALFPRPWPYALAYLLVSPANIVVLACEHLKRRPLYWKKRLELAASAKKPREP